jgi:hypothetical protein
VETPLAPKNLDARNHFRKKEERIGKKEEIVTFSKVGCSGMFLRPLSCPWN